MAKILPKLEITVDLEKPVDEIKECIAAIANAHPGQQQVILQQVDTWLGEQIASIEAGVKAKETEAQTEETA